MPNPPALGLERMKLKGESCRVGSWGRKRLAGGKKRVDKLKYKKIKPQLKRPEPQNAIPSGSLLLHWEGWGGGEENLKTAR